MVIALVVIILGGGYMFLVNPAKKVVREGVFYAVREAEFLALKRELNELNEFSKIYEDINSENIIKINKFLPPKSEIEELMKQMEVIVSQNGFFLTSLNLEDRGGESEIGQVSILMNVVGPDYTGFKSLLYTIESNLRLLDITSLTFDPVSKSAVINIIAYYKK